MSLLTIVYKFFRGYFFPMWHQILYLLNTSSIEYFIVTRRADTSCVMLPIYDDTEVDAPDDSFVLIRYNVFTRASNNVFYKVIRSPFTFSGSMFNHLVCMHNFDSLEFSTCSFMDCQTTNEDDSRHIPIKEFSLVSNELFFELFNEWLWIYYLNDDYLPNTVTTLIDREVNILSIKDTYIKLEKNKYVVMDDDWSKD